MRLELGQSNYVRGAGRMVEGGVKGLTAERPAALEEDGEKLHNR